MKTNPSKSTIASMIISPKKLSQFIRLFESKTGKKLSESEALTKAHTLLRTMSILYQPITIEEYSKALAQKMFLRTKSKKINSNKK